MFHIVLYQPEIPPNTGNVIRLTANSGTQLHLIEPLGFDLSEKSLRRAGLDYHQLTQVKVWADFAECLQALAPQRWFAISTRGTQPYAQVRYEPGDVFVFGPETRGLPVTVIETCPAECRVRIPMLPGNRSLNLSNAVAVVVYEAWRQQEFAAGE